MQNALSSDAPRGVDPTVVTSTGSWPARAPAFSPERHVILPLLLVPLLALLFALLVWPLASLAFSSVQPARGLLAGGAPAGGNAFTLENYRTIFADRGYRTALWHSLGLSSAVAAGATALCLAPAWLFTRREFRGKRLLRALFTVPMAFSGIIIGFLTIIMIGRIGFVPQLTGKLTGTPWLAGAAYQFAGLLLAYAYFEVPRATLTLESALRKLDPRLETAARSLGAGGWQRFRWVVFPLIWPALLSTFALTFNVSLGSFGVVLVISKKFSLLPLEIFDQIVAFRNTSLAAAMGMLIVGIALALNLAARGLIQRRLLAYGLATQDH